MPVEGQWERARTPLSRRDRRVVAAVAAVAAAAALAGGLIAALRPHHEPAGAACVTFRLPSTMGGATLRECGAAARAFCATQGARDAGIAAVCRRAGLMRIDGPAMRKP